MTTYREYRGKFYRLMHPRFTVLVMTLCPNNRINVMPASWNTPIGEDPPTIGVAISNDSFTRECLEYHGEATINVPSIENVDLVYLLGTVSGRDVDKVSKFGLKLLSSQKIKVPGLMDSLAIYEGRVLDKMMLHDVTFYIFEVLRVSYKESYADEYGYDFNVCNIPLHGAGRAFYRVDSRKILVKK